MRFFFYGTLIAGSANPAARAAHRHLKDIGAATIPGQLVAIPDPRGWYPALLPGEGEVAGKLYSTMPSFGSKDLAELDTWEEFAPANLACSLYVRKAARVTAGNGKYVEAQVYYYNRPLPDGALPVSGGDFAKFLAAGGRRAFGG